jgi:Tol biopolymer transport system component/DNA-binding winged helix-turn-helix (wHTH) protein
LQHRWIAAGIPANYTRHNRFGERRDASEVVNSAGQMPGLFQRQVRFGAFEVDLDRTELRKQGLRVRLQDQPFHVLAALLERPGEVVSREELIRRLWPDGTVVDFDRGLNAAVTRLRQALSDSAEAPRFVETVARHGYRFVAPVETGYLADRKISTPSEAAGAGGTSYKSIARRRGGRIAVGMGGLFVVGTMAWVAAVRSKPEMVLEQITRDRGLATEPALSPDGTLIAYASDRDGDHLKIWVRQLVSGGTAVRLTHDDADTRQPSFSPDGSKVVYRSERGGGGIEVLPVIGGDPVRLAPEGRNPRFSPDGKWIAYWTGTEKGAAPVNDPAGRIFVIPASGGQPKQVGADLPPAGNPIWSPDSQQLLVYANPRVAEGQDWWVVPINGPARKTGAFAILQSLGFTIQYATAYPQAAVWLEDGVVFAGQKGDTRSIWRVPLRATDGRISGSLQRLTQGTTWEAFPSVTPQGLLAFASLEPSSAIWSLSMNPDQQKVTGPLQRITDGDASELCPSISADGLMLAYKSTSPHEQMWLKDLQTGKKQALAPGAPGVSRPVISPDGSLIAYGALTSDSKIGNLYVVPRSGENPRRVSREAQWVFSWRHDRQDLLYMGLTPNRTVMRLNLQTGVTSQFLAKPDESLYQAKDSPDGQWLTFGAGSGPSDSRVFIVKLQNGIVDSGFGWIPVSDEHGWSDKPVWSPDGNTLYFMSNRDGFNCIWAQPLRPATKEPVGEPIAVYHFHRSRFSPGNVGLSHLEMDIARDKLVISLGELNGNIWTLRRGQ